MDLGANSEILLGVCEQVVRAGANNVRTANFAVCDCELGIATLCASSSELISYRQKQC